MRRASSSGHNGIGSGALSPARADEAKDALKRCGLPTHPLRDQQPMAHKTMAWRPRQTMALGALCLPPLMEASGRQTSQRSLVTQEFRRMTLCAEHQGE